MEIILGYAQLAKFLKEAAGTINQQHITLNFRKFL